MHPSPLILAYMVSLGVTSHIVGHHMDSSSFPGGTLEGKSITSFCFVLNKKVNKGSFITGGPVVQPSDDVQVQVKV
jgi:hypothetical protein